LVKGGAENSKKKKLLACEQRGGEAGALTAFPKLKKRPGNGKKPVRALGRK